MTSTVGQWGTPRVALKEMRKVAPMGMRRGSTLDSVKAQKMAGSKGERKGVARVASWGKDLAASWDDLKGAH